MSGPALRIAAHISAAEWGGAERRSLALLAGLAARGHQVTVYCNTARIAREAERIGLQPVIRPLGGDLMIGHALALAARLRRQRPDVLILITFRRLWLGALAGRLARVPRIIARVGLASDVARNTKYRIVLKRWIDDVVVNAHALEHPFRESLPPASRARVTVIPNGVAPPTASLTREAARRAFRLPADAFVVGTIARIVKQKRIDRLLHAVAAVPEAFALIAGDGALRGAAETLAEELGIADRVRFPGYRDDIGDVLRALDVYVVASDQEGMSGAMLEALAAGVPVVSTPVSGAAEVLLGEPECGLVVPADPAQLADAIAELRTDPERRQSLARGARTTAAGRYGAERMIGSWERLLLDAPSRKRSG